MYLPFEIIQLIYNFSCIDEKIIFNKIYHHESFLHSKIKIAHIHFLLLNQVISFQHTNYIVLKELSERFSFL